MPTTSTTPLQLSRHFTAPDTHVYDTVEWQIRDAIIEGDGGKRVFEQLGVEFPSTWSQTATDIVASKYFRGTLGTLGREHSVKQMLDRVVDTITLWGVEDGYFGTSEETDAFEAELKYLLLHQMASFNSPVWFNIGVLDTPQVASACYILSLNDDMASIMEWIRQEAVIFKGGSGSGCDISSLRGSGEPLRGGGTSSGPLSFMKAADTSAGVIKSAGRVRRAAKMIVMNIDHPDIQEFIWCKVREEEKARALIAAGYSDGIDGEAYATVAFQNANNSVRVDDEFMRRATGQSSQGTWATHWRTNREHISDVFRASDLLHQIAEATHACGDPGIQFDDTINAWHTVPNSGRINASNPCCFVGETLVDTSEGLMRFDDLERLSNSGESLPYAFSHDLATNLPVLRPIERAWKAGKTNKLVEVTTDKGITVRCTPTHRFLLRDGRYVEARDLRIGDRLRKVARCENPSRQNRRYIRHRVINGKANGEQVITRFMWEQVYGPIQDGMDVHHINEDCIDDRLSNFELIDGKSHKSHHSTGLGNPRALAQDWPLFVEIWEALEKRPNFRPTVWRWNKYIRDNGLLGIVPFARMVNGDGRIQGMTWLEFEKRINEHRCEVNDRVCDVTPIELDEAIEVYDLEVEGAHNFGVSNGTLHSIVVHNSEFMHLDNTACFAPETRISTPDGLRGIEELYNRQCSGEEIVVTTDVHSEHDNRRLLSHRRAFVSQVGEKPIVRITMRDGRSIRTTKDHKFLTVDGWKRVDEMQCGIDRICIRESGNPVSFTATDDEVIRWQMLGWITGDGVFSKDIIALTYGPDDANTAEFFEPEFNHLIKDSASMGYAYTEVRECHTYTQESGCLQISSHAKSAVQFLEECYGMKQGTAIYKDVPKSVYDISDDLRIAYLQGVFSADGCIRSSDSAREKEVMLASSSPELLRSIQLLLGDLGIASRISWFHPDGRKNPQGQLHITNQQMRKFVALIGMPLSEKKNSQCQEILHSVFAGAQKTPRQPVVTSIEDDGVSVVYDITEPVTHSLIAEGMIAHNCNLASLNLLRFLRDDNSFDVDAYRHAVRIMFTAQEILVSRASYPTEAIAKNSEDFRPLGLGYANLGAILMASGLPYDSEPGRAYAAAVTALMTGEAYAQSARLAAVKGAFKGFEANREPMIAVIEKHASHVNHIGSQCFVADTTGASRSTLPFSITQVIGAAAEAWSGALELGTQHGYRNAQATLLAPCGTISFMMDCTTTGVEPAIALVSYKKLVGGGTLKQVNGVVERAMHALGWNEQDIPELLATVKNTGNVPRYLDDTNVFATALGENAISPEAHIRMVASVQPFLSGSVSKTINMPEDATVDDIERAYILAWQLGLKSVAIYRDGCKATQPVTTQRDAPGEVSHTHGVAQSVTLSNEQVRTALSQAADHFPHVVQEWLDQERLNGQTWLLHEKPYTPIPDVLPQPHRKRLPDERPAITHKFSLNGAECYMTVGLYPDTMQPGELFFAMAKEGSTVSGFMDAFGIAVSLALQYGVPLKAMADKFRGMRFEPSGFTSNHAIPMAQSLMDYIFRWLASKFQIDMSDAAFTASVPSPVLSSGLTPGVIQRHAPACDSAGAARRTIQASSNGVVSHAPVCAECGQLMTMRTGSCFVCHNCGTSAGCS